MLNWSLTLPSVLEFNVTGIYPVSPGAILSEGLAAEKTVVPVAVPVKVNVSQPTL